MKFRLINSTRIQQFVSQVGDLDLTKISISNDPNLAFYNFYNLVFNIFNRSFPLKTKKVGCKTMNAPWCNRKLKLCIKKKYKLYNMMKRGIVSRRSFNIYKKLLI